MINTNIIMKQLLQSCEKEVVNKTKRIGEGIVFDETGELEENKINFSEALKFAGDWTGYEISCNEIGFSKEEIPLGRCRYFVEKLSVHFLYGII